MSDQRPDEDAEVVSEGPRRRPRRADTGASPRSRRADTGASPRRQPGDAAAPPRHRGTDAGAPPRARRGRRRDAVGVAPDQADGGAPQATTPEELIPPGDDDPDESYEPYEPPVAAAGAAAADAADEREDGGARDGRPGAGSRSRRRRARTRTVTMVALLAAVAVALVAVAFNLGDRARELIAPDPTSEVPDAAPGDPQPAVTVITTRDGPDGSEVATITLLAVDRESGEGTVLLVPPATIADVPGHGAFRLGEAFDFGGAALTAVSLDNLLGARADAVVTVSEEGWASFLGRLGPTEVTLAEPVVDRAEDGSGTVLLPAGPQTLDGAGLATMLSFRSSDESQLDHLPRVQAALLGVLDQLAADPHQLDALFADGAPELEVTGTAGAPDGEADVGSDLVRTVLAELAEARGRDQVTTLTLFVSPLGTGTEDAYRPDADRIEALVQERFAASRPDPGVAGGRTLQLLNGNGQPGIGADVAAVLQPAGYRVLLTGNADRFTYELTRILVYDEEPDTLAAARDVRDRLGVGQIERSGTPQSVVDLTIVIGRDFPVGGSDASADADEAAPAGEADAGDEGVAEDG